MKQLTREELIASIARVSALKDAASPDWEARVAKMNAQLAAIEKGETVMQQELKFCGFNRNGDPIVRKF